MSHSVISQLREAAAAITAVAASPIVDEMVNVCAEASACLSRGNKILAAGNGGSAADAQHFAAELVGRFKKERIGLPAIALTTDTSALTAIANDYGYDFVFSRQVEALGSEGDMLLMFSTSGNSANLVKAAEASRAKGIRTVAFLGNDGGKLKALADIVIVVQHNDTARIQEVHQVLYHILCQEIEAAL